MSQPFPAPGAGPIAGDDRPLNAREYQLLQRLLSDPFSLPMGFKTWLVGYLETSDISLPMSSIMGLPTVAAAVNSGDSAWHALGAAGEPVLQGAWVNYGGGWGTAKFRKDASGVVHLAGLIKNGAVSTTIFTLPSGHRLAEQNAWPVVTGDPAVLGRVDVYADGRVVFNSGSTGYVSLASISFYADQ